MELDKVKLQTTWNDAAGSINSNFSKILQALASINGGGTGGGGIDEAELLEFLVENGYITEDYLADFYTKGQSDAKFATITAIESLSSKIGKIEGAGYITSEALSPYLKISDADSTFATITSLGGVDERLKEIEEYFNGSGEDADNKINKWNEIVAFLNATEDTTLSGILAAYTLKSDHNALAERVTANEGAISGINTTLASHSSSISNNYAAITSLANKVNPIDTWFNEVGKFFKKDSDGVWYVDGSFYTKGQNAAGAVGSPDGGGSSGSGVMLLESWSDVPSDLSGYALSAALGIDLHERFNNYYTIGDVDSRFSGINSRLATLDSGMADRYTKAESDGRYLKLSGGTIKSSSGYPLEINSTNGYCNIALSINGTRTTSLGADSYWGAYLALEGKACRLGVNPSGTPFFSSVASNMYTLLHSGNYSGYALPITGGTIDGNITIGKSDNTGWKAINFVRSGITGFIGNSVTKMEMGMSDGYIQVGKDVLNFVNNSTVNTLIHSGNVGEYAMAWDKSHGSYASSAKPNIVGYGHADNGWKTYGPILTFGLSNYYAQLQKEYNTETLYVRSYVAGDFTDWKTIAFTDSNVASAQTLKNSNGTVGATAQSSGLVSFASHIVPNNDSQAYVGVADKAWYAVYTNGLWSPSGKILHLGANNSNHIIVNTSGNVTIGSWDMAGASAKLYVGGVVKIKPNDNYQIIFESGVGGVQGAGITFWENGWQKATIQASSLHLNPSSGGNVLVGTTTDSGYKLDVAGTGRFSNLLTASAGIFTPHITIGGITISVVDGVLRIDGNVYTTGQLGVGAVGQEGGGTGGGGVLLLNTWPTDGGSYAGYALGGNLGIDLNTRVKTLEGKATAVSFSQTLTSGKQIGVLTIDGSSSVLYAPSTYAWSEITSRPSKLSDFTDDVVSGKYLPLSGGKMTVGKVIQWGDTDNMIYATANAMHIYSESNLFINGNQAYHAGNFNPADYLPLSGGTISGNLTVDGHIIKSGHFFGVNNNDNAEWYVTDKNWQNTYTLIHSGNANKADVPWTASNILFPTGTSATWNIHSTNAYKGITVLNAVQAKPEGAPDHYAVGLSVSGYYGFTLASLGGGDVLLYRRTNKADWKTIAFTDSTVDKAKSVVDASGNALTLIHSGNIGSQFVEGIGVTYKNQTISMGAESKVRLIALTASNSVDLGAPKRYVSGLSVMSDYTGWQLVSGASKLDNGDFYIRKLTDEGKFLDWKTIAFTDSNVASATKLSDNTAFSAWGQTFFANGKPKSIDGNIYINSLSAIESYGSGFIFGWGKRANPTRYCGSPITFYVNNVERMFINESGNVTIGSTDFAGTDTKLYVNGTGRFTDLLTASAGISTPHITIGGITLSVVDGVLRIDGNVYTTGQLGVGAVGQEGGGTGGGGVLLLNTWPTDGGSYAGYALGGNLGIDLNTRVKTLEGKATAVSFSQTLTSGKQIGVLTIDGSSSVLYAPSTYAWSEITSRPSKLSDFTDDVVSGKYLSLSGGTISGVLTVTSNFTAPNVYFKTGSGKELILSPMSCVSYALGYYNGSTWKTFAFTDSNVASADYATSAGDADTLDGYSSGRFLLMTGRDYAEMDLNTLGGSQSIFTEIRTSEVTTTNSPYSGYGALLSLKDRSGIAKMQFLGSYNSSVLYFRSQQKTGADITSDWKQIAFTDTNVASAQALKHSNGTVGATVDAFGGICLSQRGIWSADGGLCLFDFDNTHLNVGYSMRNSYQIDIYGNTIRFMVGDTSKMLINSSGNVGIGTANPAYKLDVIGDFCVNRNDHWGNNTTLRISNSDNNVYFYADDADDTACNLRFVLNGTERLRLSSGGDISAIGSLSVSDAVTMSSTLSVSGNVGIGTTNPTYKLDVAGSIRTTSTLTIGTIVLTDENGTLKIAGNAYTTGQLGAGEAGRPTSGGGNVILDYDSIVDALGFTPASSSQLTTLSNTVTAISNKQFWDIDYGDLVVFPMDAGSVCGIGTTHIVGMDDTGYIGLDVGSSSYATRLYGSSILANGSDVLTKANTSFTRSYTSGTKIGTIKIGGVSTDIYAPASGLSSLWTTEYSIDVGNDVLAASKEYIGTNTIVGWDLAGSCLNDLYIGYDGYTIWMQGSVDEASDMRLKTVIDAVNLDIRDIAFAPIFNYVFKSRPQGRQMLGSSAQYWQPITPSAVSENDKGNLAMNYGAVALASVVAVAKKVLTQEEETEEIKSMVVTQKEEIANLKLKVQSLETRLAKYELN